MRKSPLFFALFLLTALGFYSPSLALSPMVEYNDLVAGQGEKGFRDGPFYSAFFNQPAGLALDSSGSRLFVADAGNDRVRVVRLTEKNRVQTLAGSGVRGSKDGPLLKAEFDHPTGLCWIGHERLLVYDRGNMRFRLVDLKAGRVSTPRLKSGSGIPLDGLPNLAGMVFLPAENTLYFRSGNLRALQKFVLRDFTVSPVPLASPQTINCGPMGVYQGHVCFSDLLSGWVFELDGPGPGKKDFFLKKLGKAWNIAALASVGPALYALPLGRSGTWMQVAPEQGAGPLKIMSVWGNLAEDQAPQHSPLPDALSNFFDYGGGGFPGFAADPGDEKRFFVSMPGRNIIVSLRDYRFDQWKKNIPFGQDELNENGLSDFDYPLRKPPQTFRILLFGDSRTYQMFEPLRWPWNAENRMETLPKKLELILNTLAALLDGPVHFQVLHLGHPDIGDGLTWFNSRVPGIAERFGVDLCLQVVAPVRNNYKGYFLWPLTVEGIPSDTKDGEYLIKPLAQRAASSALTLDFYNRCVAEHWGKPDDLLSFADLTQLIQDKPIREDLMEMSGRPLALLARDLRASCASLGRNPAYWVCFLPLGNRGSESLVPNETYRCFWREVCARKGLPFLDLTDPLNALKVSFYPTTQLIYSYHFNHDGQMLVAAVIAHELIQQKLIPLKSREPVK